MKTKQNQQVPSVKRSYIAGKCPKCIRLTQTNQEKSEIGGPESCSDLVYFRSVVRFGSNPFFLWF